MRMVVWVLWLLLGAASAFGQSRPFPGPGTPHVTGPTTVSAPNASTNSGVAVGFSVRSICAASGGGRGTQVRVTFKAGSGGGLNVNNASIGIWNGSNADTTATPVELLFSGGHGFSIAANATITSDWAVFTVVNNPVLVVVEDYGSGFDTLVVPGAGFGRFFFSASATFNVAAPGAGTGNDGNVNDVQIIEVR